MSTHRILIIEDEPDMRRGVEHNLQFEGYQVLTAADGPTGLQKAQEEHPDLILLDLMLPGMDGMEVCRKLQQKKIHIPIIMLTARSQERDKVMGLELGADDYLSKPFGIKELLARVKAVLRRTGAVRETMDRYRFADVEIDFLAYEATKDGSPLDFTPKELELMRFFIENKGVALSRDRLLDEVWGYETFPCTRTVDNHILKLRKKIEDDPRNPQYLVTIHGYGYKFVA